MDPTTRRSLLFWALVAAAAIVGSIYQPPLARSFPTYPPLLPNRATATGSGNEVKPCITCHNNPDGGQGCSPSSLWPCLNPFGIAFQSGGRRWSPALASADSDGDGFSNGAELQDPTGAWSVGLPSPGVAAYATRPGFSPGGTVGPTTCMVSSDRCSPGQYDADQDTYCVVGRDVNADHDCLDPGENTAAFDCNDGAASVNSGATELCTNAIDDDCNGLDTYSDPVCASVVDSDQDGYCPMGRDLNGDRDCTDPGESTGDVDCDDHNVLANPDAGEDCFDGVDNDCDTFVDGADANSCTGAADVDMDHYCPIGQDVTNDAGSGTPDGDCLDAGESALPSDCNDRSAAVNPGRPEVCGDGLDNDCDGDADFADSSCATLADRDGDGYCPNGKDVNRDGNCAGASDVSGPSMGFDCNDADPLVYSRATENCLDAIDQDCDGQAALGDLDCVGYLDQDQDTYCPIGGIDRNADHDCDEPNESSELSDCDDTNASVSPTGTETCFNGLDDDCNGSTDAGNGTADPLCLDYADWDYDGYCKQGQDLNGDGECVDPGEQNGTFDLRPEDSTVSPGNHESCFDHKDNDQDGLTDVITATNPGGDPDCVPTHDDDHDGYCPVGKDVNGDGDCEDPGENYALSDCDDSSPLWGPQLPEVFVEGALVQRCFDYDDNDCDGDVDRADSDCVYLLDRDRDGVCGHGLDDNQDADCDDTDEQRYGEDCDDTDPDRASTHQESCTNGIDDDCDGLADDADFSCKCQVDSQCTPSDACSLGRCVAGVCREVLDPACDDFGLDGGTGIFCGVSAPGASAPTSLLAGLATATLAALTIGRRTRRRRGARSTR